MLRILILRGGGSACTEPLKPDEPFRTSIVFVTGTLGMAGILWGRRLESLGVIDLRQTDSRNRQVTSRHPAPWVCSGSRSRSPIPGAAWLPVAPVG